MISEPLSDAAQILLSMSELTGAVTTLFDPNDSQSLGSRIQLNFGTIIGNLPTKRINVTPTSGLITTEAGGSASFEVALEEAPSDSVTINLLSSNTDEGRIDKSVLTFTTTNWFFPQLVTITGQPDFFDDGDIDYTIFVGTAISAGDSEYNGMNPDDVMVTNRDDDTAGVTITQSGGSTNVAEGGATDSYTVVLTSQPRANVTINVSGSQVSVSPTSVHSQLPTGIPPKLLLQRRLTIPSSRAITREASATRPQALTPSTTVPQFPSITSQLASPTTTRRQTCGVSTARIPGAGAER